MGKGKPHRHFDNEFKRNAVKLVVEKGFSTSKVAHDLDIHPNVLHQWRRKFMDEGSEAFVGKGNLKPDEAELKRVRKELADVKEERDILKKALSVFSRHDT